MSEDGGMDFFIFPDDMSEEDRKALVKRIRDQHAADIYNRSPQPTYVASAAKP